MKIKTSHPLRWVFEKIEDDPSFFEKKMFGCQAAYLNGKLSLVVAAQKEEPWNGLMLCTSREHHESLLEDFPQLKPHPILGKWLYVSQKHGDFETLAEKIAELAKHRDGRVGVESKKKVRKKTLKK